jgi:hypothetical protein
MSLRNRELIKVDGARHRSKERCNYTQAHHDEIRIKHQAISSPLSRRTTKVYEVRKEREREMKREKEIEERAKRESLG